MNPTVDPYFERARAWRDELVALRRIVLDCDLTEELKWRQPCYTVDGKNVAIISAFTSYCALSFFKGALLSDPDGVLVVPGPNSRSARLVRFTDTDRIAELEPTLRAYLREAVELERAGRRVDFAATRELPLPDELRDRLDASPEVRRAFEALTPGRRREYVMHVSAAKRAATRVSRVDACVPRILAGKGLRDR
jgi:uncharacterized protein YdeI (YjbR/CyaY-like superfamily)